MATILRVLLLIVLLFMVYGKECPKGCRCNREATTFVCDVNNGTVSLELDVTVGSYYSTLIIKCQDKNLVSCSSFPRLGVVARRVETYSCSPSILRCVHVVLDEPVVQELELYHVDGTLTVEDVVEFKKTKKLKVELVGDVPIPIAGINSWSSLKEMSIHGGILDVSSNAFNHTSLTNLTLLSSEVRAVPDGDFNGLFNLAILSLYNSTIEEIRVGALKGLAKLRQLKIENCPLKVIDVEAFDDVPKLEQLTLSQVLLESYPDDLQTRLKSLSFIDYSCATTMAHVDFSVGIHAFSQYPELKTVKLAMCNINTLTENLFTNSSHIETINIINNVINNIPTNVFTNLIDLITLELKNNSLTDLHDGVFDKLSTLQTLDLAENNLRTLHANIFSDLTSLETLNLEENKIHELPDGILKNVTSLKYLNLAGNGILELEVHIFSNLANLRSINLADNRMQGLPGVYNLRQLDSLDLSNNKIERLSSVIFYGLRNLTMLNLSNNQIDSMDSGTVNKIHHFSPFQTQAKLEILDLSGNKIRNFFFAWEKQITQIKKINLTGNLLTDIEVFQIDYTGLNISIDLRHNKINKIVLDPRATSPNNSSTAASQLLLDHNPINCDCNALGLLRRLKGARLEDEPQYVLNSFKCVSPTSLEGTLLAEVSPKDLICDLSKHRPENCSSFIARADINEVALKCSQMPSPLPDLNAVNFPYNFFEQPNMTLALDEQPQTIDNLDIYKLILSNASIKAIEFKPSASLRVLDLSNNNLETIPEYFFSTNITLYLSGNPLKCYCELARKLKQYNGSLADAGLIYCANEYMNLIDIDENEICRRINAWTALIGTTAVCGLFLSVIAFAIGKYIKKNWTDIVNNVFGRKIEKPVVVNQIVEKKHYDLFISFARQDEEFVRDLMPKLEYELQQKVCVYYRDWTTDITVPENIIKSVENSVNTIIILTEDYLISEWNLVAFRKANYLSKQEGKTRVIIIVLDKEVINDERLSSDMKSYIGINSCLLWKDPNFWTDLQSNL